VSDTINNIYDSVIQINDMAADIATASEGQSSVSNDIAQHTTNVKVIADEHTYRANEQVSEAETLSQQVHHIDKQLNEFNV